MSGWMVIPIGVFLATLPFFLAAEYRPDRRRVMPLKMVCSLCFLALGFLGLLPGGAQTEPLYDGLLLGGLFFSLLGDFALAWKDDRRSFLLGLVLFLAAQVLYGTAFSIFNGFSPWDILVVGALVLLPAAAYFFLDMDLGQMKLPVLAYMLVIAFMFGKALSSLYLGGLTLPARWLAPLGAGLFYLSDAILALHKFHRRPPQALRALNLITYYTGQILLALTVYYF